MTVINHYHSKSITTVNSEKSQKLPYQALFRSKSYFGSTFTVPVTTLSSALSLIFANTVWRSVLILFVSDWDTEVWGSEAQGSA